MERERVEMQESLVNEISKGMGKLKQLKVSSSEQESALKRMLSSYEEALFILTGRAPQGGQCRSGITSSSDPPASSPPVRMVSKYGGARRALLKKMRRWYSYSMTIEVKASVENSEEPADDGYRWRKYGSRPVLNSKYQRSFFGCSDKPCVAMKYAQRSDVDPTVFTVTYKGMHTCQAKFGVQSSLSEAKSSVASSVTDLNA